MRVAINHQNQTLGLDDHPPILLGTRCTFTLALTRRAIVVLHAQTTTRSTTVTSTAMLSNEGPPLLGVPIAVGSRRTPSLMAEHLNLFNTYTTARQADRRRRHSDVPHNTPVSSEDASPRAEINLTQPTVPDINHVDS